MRHELRRLAQRVRAVDQGHAADETKADLRHEQHQRDQRGFADGNPGKREQRRERDLADAMTPWRYRNHRSKEDERNDEE